MSRIVRVFRSRAKPGLVGALEQRLRDEVLPEVAAAPGLLAYHAGVPHGDTPELIEEMSLEHYEDVE